MSVRFFVTSAALMIFSWLAATYLRAVPMDTYPGSPVVTSAPIAEPTPDPQVVADRPENAPVQLISTATQ